MTIVLDALESLHAQRNDCLAAGDDYRAAVADALPDLLRAVRAAEAYGMCADWYRRCLEDIIDRTHVRGLGEARAGFDHARDSLDAALAVFAFSEEKAA